VAEVTAGGVPLDEIDPATMGSRCCPGVYLVGEILDVDGRLGGFNFQWSWSSGWVAGRAIAIALSAGAPPVNAGGKVTVEKPNGLSRKPG
jgi:predicted flavoprotein YhiN